MSSTKLAVLSVVAIAVVATCSLAGDEAELKKVVAQAKKAGNTEALKKRTAWTVVTKSMQLDGEKQSYVSTAHVQLPDRVWSEIVITNGDKKQSILAVVNGSQGWRKEGGTVTEMPPAWAEGVLRNFRAEGIRLICSLDDPNCESTLIEAGKVGDRPTHTVKVHSEGARYDKILHLDQKTGALLMETDDKNDFQIVHSDVKIIDEVPIAQTLTYKVKGKATVEKKLEVGFVEKFDDKQFEKPKPSS